MQRTPNRGWSGFQRLLKLRLAIGSCGSVVGKNKESSHLRYFKTLGWLVGFVAALATIWTAYIQFFSETGDELSSAELYDAFFRAVDRRLDAEASSYLVDLVNREERVAELDIEGVRLDVSGAPHRVEANRIRLTDAQLTVNLEEDGQQAWDFTDLAMDNSILALASIPVLQTFKIENAFIARGGVAVVGSTPLLVVRESAFVGANLQVAPLVPPLHGRAEFSFVSFSGGTLDLRSTTLVADRVWLADTQVLFDENTSIELSDNGWCIDPSTSFHRGDADSPRVPIATAPIFLSGGQEFDYECSLMDEFDLFITNLVQARSYWWENSEEVEELLRRM